jgi:hypothetical protein
MMSFPFQFFSVSRLRAGRSLLEPSQITSFALFIPNIAHPWLIEHKVNMNVEVVKVYGLFPIEGTKNGDPSISREQQ